MKKISLVGYKNKVWVKRPLRSYVQFSLWFSFIAVLVLALGFMVFFSMIALRGDAVWESKGALTAAAIASAVVLFANLHLIAELFKNKTHRLARWTRQSLRLLSAIIILPLAVTIFAIHAGTDNSSTQITSDLPTWAQYNEVKESEAATKRTRRYQYMYCSNGTYRYYTDEQFKNPNSGFTDGSSDNCAENNQGKMTQLADTPPKNTVSYTPVPAYVPSECTKVTIPYRTNYVEDPLYPIGYRYEGYGSDGYRYTCTKGSNGHVSSLDGLTVQPYDKTVRIGTGAASRPTPARQQDPIARQKCMSDYNSARAQLQMHGAANSSAMDYLNQLHTQCLSRAGY